MIVTERFTDEIVTALQEGSVGVLRTDTLYGIVASADNQTAVERVYTIKQRTPTKPAIVLIASYDQMYDEYDAATRTQLETMWPGKNSIILPAANAPHWLTRDTMTLAYRIPDNSELQELLQKTGPLTAPSANPEGDPPARTIEEAKQYFGDTVDFYVDGGEVTDDTPSQLYRFGDEMERLR